MAWLDIMTGNTTNGVIADIAVANQSWRGCAPKIRKMAVQYPELSKADIARSVGCTWDNVDQVLGRFLGSIKGEELPAFQANKADIFDALQFRTLASITDADISNASYLQRITGAAILEDKARLVRGQATSINVTALVDVANLLRQRMTAPTGNVTIVGGTPEDVG